MWTSVATRRENGRILMSAYELVMMLRGSDDEEHYETVQGLLRDLAAIPIVMEPEPGRARLHARGAP